MSLKVEIDARGVGDAQEVLAGIGRRASRAQAVWPIVGEVFADAERKHFDSRGGGSWEGLADSTKSSKARKHLDPRLMRASNALFHSLTEHRAPGAVREYARGSEMTFGTDIFYAKFHQEGDGVPKRSLLAVDDGTKRRAATVIARFLVTGHAPTHF